MQGCHEAGHVLGAWLTGGRVVRVVLHPATISRTDIVENPHPVIVLWMGPAVGCLLPLTCWWIARGLRLSADYVLRFITGFCLVANGCYLGAGALFPVGDAADLLALRQPVWALATFGLITVPAGMALWHGQGRCFGFGPQALDPNRRHAGWLGAILIVIVLIELTFSPR